MSLTATFLTKEHAEAFRAMLIQWLGDRGFIVRPTRQRPPQWAVDIPGRRPARYDIVKAAFDAGLLAGQSFVRP